MSRSTRRPRVAIDAAQLQDRGKGNSRYFAELLPELARAAPEFELVVLAQPSLELPERARSLTVQRIKGRPAIVWEQLRLPWITRAGGFQLLHTVSDRLAVFGSPPAVVHLFEDPRYRLATSRITAGTKQKAADTLTRILYPRTLRHAAIVLAGSESTRRDVLERGIPEDRVRVVYPGVGSCFRPAETGEITVIRERLGCPNGFVLHLSSDDPRDNSHVALEAYAVATEPGPGTPPLLIAGAVRARERAQQELASRLGIRDRVRWLGWVSDERLVELYQAATAYIDPSLYEGFGFQVAEALASGAPVVCSDTTSLPEVVGEAGLLCRPDDVRGFAEAIANIVSSPELRSEYAARGPHQARRFRWSETAREAVAAWREVLKA